MVVLGCLARLLVLLLSVLAVVAAAFCRALLVLLLVVVRLVRRRTTMRLMRQQTLVAVVVVLVRMVRLLLAAMVVRVWLLSDTLCSPNWTALKWSTSSSQVVVAAAKCTAQVAAQADTAPQSQANRLVAEHQQKQLSSSPRAHTPLLLAAVDLAAL